MTRSYKRYDLHRPKTSKYINIIYIDLFETTTLIVLNTITLPNPSQTSTICEWNIHEVAEFNCLQSVTFMSYLSKDWHFVTDTDILTYFTHWHSICLVYIRLIDLEFNQRIGWKNHMRGSGVCQDFANVWKFRNFVIPNQLSVAQTTGVKSEQVHETVAKRQRHQYLKDSKMFCNFALSKQNNR